MPQALLFVAGIVAVVGLMRLSRRQIDRVGDHLDASEKRRSAASVDLVEDETTGEYRPRPD